MSKTARTGEHPVTPPVAVPVAPPVALPADLAADVRERVGEQGFAAYVSAAVARQLERDALDDAVARMEDRHGPVDEAEVAALMARWES